MQMQYYTWILILTVLALVVLGILVYENGRMEPKTKNKFYLTYLIIILSAIAEWIGVYLNGAPEWTRGLHMFVKWLDYSLSPIASVCFVRQLNEKNKLEKAIRNLLLVHVAFEAVAVFSGWTVYIDENNIYHHGDFFYIYAAVLVVIVFYVIYEFYLYGRNFTKKNKLSLAMIALFVCLGLAVQEVIAPNNRTVYLTLAYGSILLYIHYCEFSQIMNDRCLTRQKTLLERDVLTGLYSHYAYNEALKLFRDQERLPEDLVIFSVDVNGLKLVNDHKGHEAGDELIKGAAQCIADELSAYGKCYRTGGDEFVAILYMPYELILEVCKKLERRTALWSGNLCTNLYLAYGYAAAVEYPLLTIEKVIHMADQGMYKMKAEYYLSEGNDRRGSRYVY